MSREVSNELLELYEHWDYDLEKVVGSGSNLSFDELRMSEIRDFAALRMKAWENKVLGRYPNSDDQVLSKFKFCNVYRELDRQTIYFHTKLKYMVNDFEKWLLNMFVARFLANSETFDSVGVIDVGSEAAEALDALSALPSPKYGNAYIFPISTIINSQWPNREELIFKYAPLAIREVALIIQNQKGGSVISFLNLILPVFKFNHRFLWTEVLIDVHYQFPNLVNLDTDFHIGPGAKPSLEYLSSGDTQSLGGFLDNLAAKYPYIDDVNLEVEGKRVPLSAENWEGICCEFRKYKNLKNGRGRRRLYKPIG